MCIAKEHSFRLLIGLYTESVIAQPLKLNGLVVCNLCFAVHKLLNSKLTTVEVPLSDLRGQATAQVFWKASSFGLHHT